MITGKKITNCPLTTQVNLKAGKEVSTKITSQLMKKMPTNLLQATAKNDMETNVNSSKLDDKGSKQISKDKYKKQKNIKYNQKNQNQQQPVMKNDRNDKATQNANEQLETSSKHIYSQNNVKLHSNILTNKNEIALIQQQKIGQYNELQLSGEHDFIAYKQQYQQQEEPRQRPAPYMYEQQIKSEGQPQKQIELNELGINMQVFSLQADEIMSKQYFVV